jgi:invasion protein IalB
MLKFLKVLMPAVLVVGCGLKPSIDDEKLSNLDFSLVDFFVGETMAHGQFQDVFG